MLRNGLASVDLQADPLPFPRVPCLYLGNGVCSYRFPEHCRTPPGNLSPTLSNSPHQSFSSSGTLGRRVAMPVLEIGGGVPPRQFTYQERRIIMTMVRWDSSRDMAALPGADEPNARGRLPPSSEKTSTAARGCRWSTFTANGQHELVLKAELPDMKEEDIELTVEDNTLTLRGEKKLDTEVTEEQFHRIERSYGSFARTFALPPTVDAGKVSAQDKAGVLTVRLPMREEAKPNKIKVAVEA